MVIIIFSGLVFISVFAVVASLIAYNRKSIQLVKAGNRERLNRLQDLSHDLKTPLASLRSLSENLKDYGNKMTSEDHLSFCDSIIREVKYLGKLVSSMLLLAEVEEQSANFTPSAINLKKFLSDEIEAFNSILSSDSRHLKYSLKGDVADVIIHVDKTLFKRAIRNALDNTQRFAKENVEIVLIQNKESIKILIRDDGSGFSDKQALAYGKREQARIKDNLGRLSSGLGSTIITSIVKLHGGQVNVSNWYESNQKIGGAQVEIVLFTNT